VLSTDDLLQKFWETEEPHIEHLSLSLDEQSVMTHFQRTHRWDETGCFIVLLPRKMDVMPLRESRTLHVCGFLSLEHSLRSKNQYQGLSDVIEEYFKMGHAEPVPEADLFVLCCLLTRIRSNIQGMGFTNSLSNLSRAVITPTSFWSPTIECCMHTCWP